MKYINNPYNIKEIGEEEDIYLNIILGMYNDKIVGTPLAMDLASEKGQIYIVRWLHCNSNGGCSKNAMDNAAKGGHIEVVKWLYEHRKEGCVQSAIKLASEYGHNEVAEWLWKKYYN